MTPDPYTRETGNPKSLVLDLLLAHGEAPLPVACLLAAAGLFGISENHLRVTLVRLCEQGMVQAQGRAVYTLGPAAASLAHEVARWRQSRQRLCAWQGHYLAIHTCGPSLGRSHAPHLRALKLLGFAPLHPGLQVRPYNLDESPQALHQRLQQLGLHPQAVLLVVQQFTPADQARLPTLWDGAALNLGYRLTREALEHWLAQAHTLDTARAARESYLLGGNAIRQLIYDPLLPEPWVDGGERDAFVNALLAMDDYGRGIWQQFFATLQTL